MKKKKIAIFGTDMKPVHKRKQFKEIIKNNLEKAGLKTFIVS
jgi:ubiquitin